jgi:Molybdopterin-binding domain of aldehyde dehydrogenase
VWRPTWRSRPDRRAAPSTGRSRYVRLTAMVEPTAVTTTGPPGSRWWSTPAAHRTARATTSRLCSPRFRQEPTSPWSRSTPRRATPGWCGWWPATTPGASSTPCWPTASGTAASRHRRPGVAQALYEQMAYDADGNPLTTTFADYAIVSAAELPSFELVDLETPTWVKPTGRQGHRRVARSVPRRRCTTPCATRWPNWACATSTCRARPNGCGVPSPQPAPPAPDDRRARAQRNGQDGRIRS